jgi:hypothetical protein
MAIKQLYNVFFSSFGGGDVLRQLCEYPLKGKYIRKEAFKTLK